MPLPVYLSEGFISVYNSGSQWGMFGFTQPLPNGQQPSSPIAFGVVDQINSVPAQLVTGASVMYNINDVIAPIFYDNRQFNILPGGKVIAVEYVYNIIVPPAP